MLPRRAKAVVATLLLTAPMLLAAESAETGHNMSHQMMMLVLELGVILVAAKLSNLLFERLRLPGVLGELCAGIVIGPSLLGGLPLPGFSEGLFPFHPGFPVSPELYGLCSVAAVVLLFMVGLETDLRLFLRYSVAGAAVGIGGVLVSFLLGDLVAVAFSPMLFGEALGPFAPSCLVLGVMSTATSVGITARVLSERRRLDSPEGVTILAGAVIDDVLGIILLAVSLGLISASKTSGSINWGHIALIAAKAIGIWLTATVLGLMASRRISLLLKWFRDHSSIALMALGLALVLAGLFEEAGLAMVIGAYVMGLALSRTDITHVVRENLEPIYGFLVPVFFVVMGMLVDVRMLFSMPVLTFGAVYTVAAVAAKILGCGAAALCCNFNARGALRIGLGMLPRGEVALIIAGIGLAAGVLSPQVFGVGVLMTLVTTLLAPPLLVQAFRSDASGLRRADPRPEGTSVMFQFPSPETVELLVEKLFTVFEAEGYFVHTLNHDERLYQLRKDDVIISFRQHATDLVFDCARPQVPLVAAAMYEVVAELELTLRELRKPVDMEAIARHMQVGQEQAPSPNSIAGYLSPAVCIPRLQAADKAGAIDELLARLVDCDLVGNLAAARRAVLTREESMSTGMQFGVAIPHGRTDEVSQLVCAIGLKPEGVDFDSLDGAPSRIIILTLSPRRAAAPHVQLMSTISQILNERGRAALLACERAVDMHAVLTGAQPSPLPARKAPSTEGPGDLADFLHVDRLIPALQSRTKNGAIDELLACFTEDAGVDDAAAVRRAVFEREEQMSTGIENGIAVPHARTPHVAALLCAVGLSLEGIEFDAIDGQPTHIVALTLSPSGERRLHTQFMAMLTRRLGDTDREALLGCRTGAELLELLAGKDEVTAVASDGAPADG